MTTISIELPDQLAEEARSHGPHAAEPIEAMIREALRRWAGVGLLETAGRLATADCPPMAMAEIQEEVDAVRAERRRRAPGT